MPPLAVTGATVFQATSGPALPDATIVVDDGRITQVGPADAVATPTGAHVIDARGKTVVPGLIDLHAHLFGEATLALYLAAGVTTVKDVGNTLEEVLRLRAAEAAGAVSPRIHACGPLLDGDPPFAPGLAWVLTSAAEGEDAVDRLASAGVDGLKLYMRLTEDVAGPVIARAHDYDLPVTAHLGRVPLRRALALGLDGVEHVAQALYSEVVPGERQLDADDRIHLGQSVFWARFLEGWSTAEQFESAAELLLAHDTFLVTTLVAYDRLLASEQERVSAPGAAYVPENLRTSYWEAGYRLFTDAWSPADFEQGRRAFERIKAAVGSLHAAGARVVAGTDAPALFVVPGFALHRELELLVECGISPADAIRAATQRAAEVLGRADEIGTLEPGKRADLVIVDGDPLRDIGRMARIDAVMKGGEVLTPDGLLAPVAGNAPLDISIGIS
jgi:cytosine/adenosine deaminase-related metal-dependent hydrolase